MMHNFHIFIVMLMVYDGKTPYHMCIYTNNKWIEVISHQLVLEGLILTILARGK